MKEEVSSKITSAKFKTYYGGFITLCFLFAIAAYTAVSVYFLVLKANPTITSQQLIKDVNGEAT